VAGATACRDAAADADAEGVTAGCDAAEDADADAGADVDAGAEAGALEVTGVVADDEEAGDEVHPATPAPATSATAPAAARRPASLVEPSISNPISPRPRRRSSTMSRNLAVYTPFRDDVRFAVVSGRL
jgi:hypothetical protein